MTDFDYKQLNDTLQSRIRVAIIAALVSVIEADFNFLKGMVKTTDGNLSTHLRKLEDAGYVSMKKKFVDRKPQTKYRITEKGKRALEEHINVLEKLIKK
ncbi:MAG TPA: transcriptional regulator [Candidatus Acidoferrales bacterium]|nr:transcriptional regulator [Candidatus Acidoferrales bacterium]